MKILRALFVISIFLSACGAEKTSAPGGQPASFKKTVVSLTFDDGDADNYQIRSILKENNLRATFYVVSGFTGTEGYMTADELRGLYEDGNEIGGHTVNHLKLTEVRGAELKQEVCQNRVSLLSYGFAVRSFAYPFGQYDAEAARAVKECGYNSARIVTGGPEQIPPADPYALRAFPYVVKDSSVAKMQRYVTQAEEGGGGWVVFTFHHVCDRCDQYSIKPQAFARFAQWLGERKKEGLTIKTVGEIVGGEVQPAVAP